MSSENMNDDSENKQSITALNALLRGEISAAETYNQAITKMRNDPVPELIDNHNSHRQRVEVLRNQILQLGGTPAESSGVWGAMAKLVQGGAKLFGRQAALAALEEGEDRGLKDYRDSLGKLDPESRRVVERNLLPAQEHTHRTMSDLKHQHADGSSPVRGNGGLMILAILVPLLALGGCGEEHKLTIDQVPAPAKATIEKQAANGRITEIREEQKDGKTCYRVTVEQADKTSHYTVDQAGNVIN